MNLNKLFKIQSELDKRIVEKHKLHDDDLLPKKILALQVELGELANELPEVFKFWSKKKNNYEKALVEYCDCLHFILSIGLEIGALGLKECWKIIEPKPNENIVEQFNELFHSISHLWVFSDKDSDCWSQGTTYFILFENYLNLGKLLGFTWDEIEESYLQKNKINHERQESGY